MGLELQLCAASPICLQEIKDIQLNRLFSKVIEWHMKSICCSFYDCHLSSSQQTVHICVPPCHQQCLYTMYTIHGVHSFCDVYRSWLNQVLQYVPSSSLFSMLPREGQRLEQSRWIWNHHPSRKATNRRNPTTWEYWPYLGTLPNFPLQCSLHCFCWDHYKGCWKWVGSKSARGAESISEIERCFCFSCHESSHLTSSWVHTSPPTISTVQATKGTKKKGWIKKNECIHHPRHWNLNFTSCPGIWLMLAKSPSKPFHDAEWGV